MSEENHIEVFGFRLSRATEEPIPELVVKFNRMSTRSVCAVCSADLLLDVGPMLVVEKTGQPICPKHVCGRVGSAGFEESAIFEAATDWCALYMPPPTARFTTLRGAIYRYPTAIYTSGGEWSRSGELVLREHRELLDAPVVWVNGQLYRADNKRVEDQEPLFELDDMWAGSYSVADTLQHAITSGTTWMTLDGLQWTSQELLRALTTMQLAVHITWMGFTRDETEDGTVYHALVPFNRQEQHAEDIPLLIEIGSQTDQEKAITAVFGLNHSVPKTRPATEKDRPFWPLDRKDA
jgi:hypothetical protein